MINEETFSADKSAEHEDNLRVRPSMVEVKDAWKCVSISARAFIKRW